MSARARVIVIGDGLEAILASWILRQHPGLDVWRVFERVRCTEAEAQRALLTHTEPLANLLRSAGVAYASFIPHDGVLLRGAVEEFPRCLGKLDGADARRVLFDLRQKSGEAFRVTSTFRPKHPRKLRVDVPELRAALTQDERVVSTRNWTLESGALRTDWLYVDYDFVVFAQPLWRAAGHTWFEIPEAQTLRKTTTLVEPRRLGPYRRWEAVITPYTPEDSAFRMTNLAHAVEVELRDDAEPHIVASELNFLFPDGYSVLDIHARRGALVPLRSRVRWPENVIPLGAVSEWRADAALEDVIDSAYGLMRRWTRHARTS